MAKSKGGRQVEVPAEWGVFGWQGIRVRVPREWTPASLTGGYDDGYFRLDGPDQPRLEVKWAHSRSFVDIDRVVARYLRSLTKGRAGRDIQVQERAKLGVKMGKERSSVRYFGWRGEQEALGAAWYCRECERTMLVQILGPRGADLRELAEQVLAGLRDHSPDDWELWALYELRCEVPKGFRLVGQELLTGLLRLSFERGREKLSIVRWGLADVALEGTSLEQWLREKSRKAWRPFNVKLEGGSVKGHEGVAIAGSSAAPLVGLFAAGMRLVGRSWPSALRGAAWLCEPSNKIFHVEAVVDPADEALVAEIIDRVVCHDEGKRGREG